MSFILDPNKPPTTSVVQTATQDVGLMPAFKPGRYNEYENELTDSQFKAVNFIEQYWWQNRTIPTLEKIEQATGLSGKEAKEFWSNENVLMSVKARNIEMDDPNGLLSREQLLCVNVMLMPDNKSVREKLKILNIKPATYQAWQNDPAFMNYLRTRMEREYGDIDVKAKKAVINGVESGDFAFTKFFYELSGEYSPRMDVNVNVDGILVKVVEILERHISDVELLLRIADDFAELSGRKKHNAIDILPVGDSNASS